MIFYAICILLSKSLVEKVLTYTPRNAPGPSDCAEQHFSQ
jgi:hypothetical protein